VTFVTFVIRDFEPTPTMILFPFQNEINFDYVIGVFLLW